MASKTFFCSFPILELAAPSSSSSSATAPIRVRALLPPNPTSSNARSSSLSLQIVRAQQNGENWERAASDELPGPSSETLLVAGRSRREIVGLGAMLATTGMLSSNAPETNAAMENCAEFTTAPSGLAFCDTAVGSGIPASKGLLIKDEILAFKPGIHAIGYLDSTDTAHYSGKLESGQVFDSSYNRGKPLVFRIGVGEVIRGWDEGILGTADIPPMLAGGKRTLRIPPQLAYGERGAGCRGGSCLIPPNSVLVFDVEFVGKA